MLLSSGNNVACYNPSRSFYGSGTDSLMNLALATGVQEVRLPLPGILRVSPAPMGASHRQDLSSPPFVPLLSPIRGEERGGGGEKLYGAHPHTPVRGRGPRHPHQSENRPLFNVLRERAGWGPLSVFECQGEEGGCARARVCTRSCAGSFCARRCPLRLQSPCFLRRR